MTNALIVLFFKPTHTNIDADVVKISFIFVITKMSIAIGTVAIKTRLLGAIVFSDSGLIVIGFRTINIGLH